MANYPTDFEAKLQVLTPSMDVGERGHAQIVNLAELGLVAVTGIDIYHAGTLASIASQDHIREFCPKDETESRFGTLASTRKWLAKGGGRGMAWIGDVPGHEGPLTDADLRMLEIEDVKLLAYGWSGREENEHIPEADITTAYRVSAEGQRRAKLGLALTELMVASAVHVFGADPEQISLETWAGNERARSIYQKAGFIALATLEGEKRPTLQPVGTRINGETVFAEGKDDTIVNVVRDTRIFQRLSVSVS